MKRQQHREHDPRERIRIAMPFDQTIERALQAPWPPPEPKKARPAAGRKRGGRRSAAHR